MLNGIIGFEGFPGGSAGEESTCTVGDLGSIPMLGRSPREGKGYPLQYSGLENSMDCIVHGVCKESDMTEQISLHFTSLLWVRLVWDSVLPGPGYVSFLRLGMFSAIILSNKFSATLISFWDKY